MLDAHTGAMSFRTAPSVQHRIGWMRRPSLSKMHDVEAATIVDLDASVFVQSVLLVEAQAGAMETTVSSRLEHGGSFVLL